MSSDETITYLRLKLSKRWEVQLVSVPAEVSVLSDQSDAEAIPYAHSTNYDPL